MEATALTNNFNRKIFDFDNHMTLWGTLAESLNLPSFASRDLIENKYGT
jgi:hypothetical protein